MRQVFCLLFFKVQFSKISYLGHSLSVYKSIVFFVVLFCFLNHSSNSNILSATQNPTYAALWRRAIVVSLTRSPVSDMQWVQTVCWFLESLCPWCRQSPSGLGIVASLTATLPSGVFASTGQLLTKQNWEVTVRRPNPGHASFRKRKDGVPVSRPESTRCCWQ